MTPLDVNLLLLPARPRDVVGRLICSSISMSRPKAFSIRSAISCDSEDLLLSKLDRAGLVTRRTLAAAVTVSPTGSRTSVRMKSPGWGGLSIRMVFTLVLSVPFTHAVTISDGRKQCLTPTLTSRGAG